MMQQVSTKSGRREPRFPLQTPTLVFGYDRSGRAFMEQAQTLDISIAGARLTGLSSEVAPGFILAVQQGDRRARFQVLWVGQPNTDLEGQIGLSCVEVGGHTRKRILCIETSPSEPTLQRSYLETAGYELVCLTDWRQGMAVFQESAFDLLIVDVQSGHNEPEEFINFVRLNSPRTRVILLSNNPGWIPEALLNLADGFINKSNSRHELLTVVEEMIGAGNQVRWPLARLAARYTLDTPVSVFLRRSGLPVSLQGRSTDISELGLGVELSAELLPGELVRLCFRLPGNDADLTPQATIRRRLGSHYGVEFVNIERARLEELRLACQKLPRISLPQPV
jgi:DNA-binding response OmpR family regulator